MTNFPNFFFAEVDGTDPVESYAAMTKAVAHCRARKGPAFVHGHVTRPYSHSLSDNDKLYRSAAELEAENLRDPLPKLQLRLLREGVIDEEGITRLEKAVDDEIQAATDRVLRAPFAPPESIYNYVYSPNIDPTSKEFASERANPSGPDRTMADLINACLKDEMKRDPRIIVFGEDVADCSREENLKSGAVKGKGGVFKLTAGLQCEYGSDRVFNSPLAEANIVGRAVGVATRGMKPVAEIQFFDYIWPAMHQLRNELAPAALAIEQRVLIACGHTGRDRRVSDRGRALSLAVGRGSVHPHAGNARRVSVECARCERPAAHGDSL